MFKKVRMAEEVQFGKGIKRKLDMEVNHEKEILYLKDIEKLQKKPKTDKANRHANLMINESNGDTSKINSLPDEVILEIFSYLKQNQLGQIARVCRRWNVLTESPILWKRVNVQFSPFYEFPTTTAKSFINRLPSCVTSIRLDFSSDDESQGRVDFVELCVILQEKCPHLEALIFTRTDFSCSFSSVINSCTHFLQNVKKVVFRCCIFQDCIDKECMARDCKFRDSHSTSEHEGISKMEILEVFNCDTDYHGFLNKPLFSRMPHLKELHLYGSKPYESWFEEDTSFLNQLNVLNLGGTCFTSMTFSAIQNHNIKELCVNFSELDDHDFIFSNSAFSHLKTICIKNSDLVTCEGVVSLLQSCPSLEYVYVDELVAESFEMHPFVVARRCKSGIVKAIDCYHGKESYRESRTFK